MSAGTHRDRHIRLRECADELGADFLQHHPNADLAAVSYQQVLDWSASEAEDPTEPVGPHHNGAVFDEADDDDDDRSSGAGGDMSA